MSSSLTELKINVETFYDCLYFLDGRLDSLTKLIINVKKVPFEHIPSHINCEVNIILIIMFSKKNVADVIYFVGTAS
jgi:hypothetical protein